MKAFLLILTLSVAIHSICYADCCEVEIVANAPAQLGSNQIISLPINQAATIDLPSSCVIPTTLLNPSQLPSGMQFVFDGKSLKIAGQPNVSGAYQVDIPRLSYLCTNQKGGCEYCGKVLKLTLNITSGLTPAAPIDVILHSKKVKKKEGGSIESVIVEWLAPPNLPAPGTFKIYLDENLRDLSAIIPNEGPGKFRLKIHQSKRERIKKIFVIAVGTDGSLSPPVEASLRMKGKK